MLFRSDVRVSFSGSEDQEHEAVDYIAEKMEHEARIVAQMLSDQEERLKKGNNNRSETAAVKEKGGGRYGKTGVSRGKKADSRTVIFGRPFYGEPISMADVDINSGNVILSGEVIKFETRELKNGAPCSAWT